MAILQLPFHGLYLMNPKLKMWQLRRFLLVFLLVNSFTSKISTCSKTESTKSRIFDFEIFCTFMKLCTIRTNEELQSRDFPVRRQLKVSDTLYFYLFFDIITKYYINTVR